MARNDHRHADCTARLEIKHSRIDIVFLINLSIVNNDVTTSERDDLGEVLLFALVVVNSKCIGSLLFFEDSFLSTTN